MKYKIEKLEGMIFFFPQETTTWKFHRQHSHLNNE